MSPASWWLEPSDLLRQRRLERGLPPVAAPLPPARRLLLQGGGLGLAVLMAVLLGWLLALWREQLLAARLVQLSGVPASLHRLEGQLRQEQVQIKALQDRDAALARGLVAASSGSALLSQLAAITPQGVQLSEVSVSAHSLTLKGLASDPGAFARVNALALLLAESPLIRTGDVKVIKLSREESPAQAQPQAQTQAQTQAKGTASPSPAPMPVRWELAAGLADLNPARQLPALQRLGADGMARRLQTLVSLGLMP